MLSLTPSKVAGNDNGMAYLKVVCWLHYYSNIYTNDQPIDQITELLIYTDDLCVTSQESMFEIIEANLTSALDELHLY